MRKFFQVYKDELPFSLSTFYTKYLTNKLKKRMVDEDLVFMGGGKIITYKVLDDEKFKKFLFSLGKGTRK